MHDFATGHAATHATWPTPAELRRLADQLTEPADNTGWDHSEVGAAGQLREAAVLLRRLAAEPCYCTHMRGEDLRGPREP
jgi:hypothetical protein